LLPGLRDRLAAWRNRLLAPEETPSRPTPATAQEPAAKRPSPSAIAARTSPLTVIQLFWWTLTLGVVAGAFLYHLHVRYEGVRLGYAVSKARAETVRLLAEQRQLKLELATFKAPDRVQFEARERLGMQFPDHSRIRPVEAPRGTATSGGAL